METKFVDLFTGLVYTKTKRVFLAGVLLEYASRIHLGCGGYKSNSMEQSPSMGGY